MKAKTLSIARLSTAERQTIVDALKQSDFSYKDMMVEVLAFIESLLEDLRSSKITASTLGTRLMSFLSEKEKEKKAQQMA